MSLNVGHLSFIKAVKALVTLQVFQTSVIRNSLFLVLIIGLFVRMKGPFVEIKKILSHRNPELFSKSDQQQTNLIVE